VKAFAEQPLQNLMVTEIETQARLLRRLSMAILICPDRSAFITSDNPCAWFDAEAYKRPPMFRGPALMYPSIEISLPVSPHHLILLNRRDLDGYRQSH